MKVTSNLRAAGAAGAGEDSTWLRRLCSRQALLVLALLVLGAGALLNWSWLVAIGIAPILLAVAPCLAMCAAGLCMGRDKKASAPSANDVP